MLHPLRQVLAASMVRYSPVREHNFVASMDDTHSAIVQAARVVQVAPAVVWVHHYPLAVVDYLVASQA